jgi:drug/metabolite transporter (DMT)-like permease
MTDGQARSGILLLVLALLVFANMEALAKRLSADYPVLQLVWARYTFHVAAMAPFLLARSRLRGLLATHRLGLQLLRSLFLLGMTLFFFWGISRLPLADATALMFVSPLIVTVLSVPMLGEQVGWRRYAAVAVGFCGMIVLLRPGGAVQWAVLLPLTAAVCYALYQLTTRLLVATEPTVTTLAYTASVGLVVSNIAAPLVWVAPDAAGWAGLVAVGILAAMGNALFILAFRAPASLLAPFNYVHLLWATALGWLVFGQLPDRWTVIGALVICASGLYVFHRETKTAR